MKKTELVVGAVIVIFLYFFIGTTVAEVAQAETYNLIFGDLSSNTKKIIGIAITLVVVLNIVVGVWFSIGKQFEELNNKLLLKASIPWTFIFTLSIVILGGLLILGFGMKIWGSALMCMGIPAIIIILILIIRKESSKSKS